MLEFIEKNKRLLVSYCTVLRVLGWILLCMAVVGITLLALEALQTGGGVTLDGTFGMLKRSYGIFINIGLVSLGLAQFIRYICGQKMGLLLRYGDKIFYLYAILGVWHEIFYDYLVVAGKTGGNSSSQLNWLLFILPVTLLYNATKALILIGLGLFLKQLIAAIERSKIEQH
jgi:hypothetical protein